MTLKVVNNYEKISAEWFLGDEGDILDHEQGPNAIPIKEFHPWKARLFLEYLQTGMSFRQATLEVPVMESVVRSWTRGCNGATENFIEAHKLALIEQTHRMAEEIIDIADGTDRLTHSFVQQAANGIKNPFVFKGEDGEDARPSMIIEAIKALHSRTGARIDSRKWLSTKRLPLSYGDKLGIEHTGNAKKPVSFSFKDLTTEQLEKLANLDEELNGGKA